MRLRQLLREVYPDSAATVSADAELMGLCVDSRNVRAGDLFLALRGTQLDGRRFIEEAVRQGAAAVASDEAPSMDPGVPVFILPEGRISAAKIASAFYGRPAERLRCIGVTGTNGKTTSSYLIEHLLASLGRAPGLLGTILRRFAGIEEESAETTPGPVDLHRTLRRMVDAGCDHAVMEVSSHALDQRRVEGIPYTAALFTNLTQDHLDYHGSMDAYFAAKARLFEGLSDRAVAVLNADDPASRRLAALTKARLVTYGTSAGADVRVLADRWDGRRTHLEIDLNGRKIRARSPLIGRHNIANALGALGVLTALGEDVERCAEALENFPGVPGRLETVERGQGFPVFVDFAHTPDGLENVLSALKPYVALNGRLIVVFGCGGDRDRTKRPKMGAIAARLADKVFITSDNPRSEDPSVIASEIRAGLPRGFKGAVTVLDRPRAVREALLSARPGDIVLLAGKGHERYQIIAGTKHPYSDRRTAEKVLDGF
ncbi:MAG: UDP-N-acetylmuramoyl-L-alanyl-D-glutamate--2,6-diaminopimelate ligase [Candidatus Omnitrophica bacterium]|nr:UDP-N-acetylmuramoyl-L-alanyl-D-glutamate--2,6-diaminopimelate ligase [Candidatus Omnitrophota bacterium]